MAQPPALAPAAVGVSTPVQTEVKKMSKIDQVNKRMASPVKNVAAYPPPPVKKVETFTMLIQTEVDDFTIPHGEDDDENEVLNMSTDAQQSMNEESTEEIQEIETKEPSMFILWLAWRH